MPKIKQIRPTYSTIIRQKQARVQFDSFIFMDNMLFYISCRKKSTLKMFNKIEEGNEL